MPVTTRKAAQADASANSSPLTAMPTEVAEPVQNTTIDSEHSSDASLSDNPSDDDASDEVLSDNPSDDVSDHDSDHSDYATGPKKRKRVSGANDQESKAKKRMTDFTTADILPVPDLVDEEYARNEEDTAEQSDNDGLWSVDRRHKGKAASPEEEEEGPEVTIEVPNNNANAKIEIHLSASDLIGVLKNAGFTGLTLPVAAAATCVTTASDATLSDITLIEDKPKTFVDLPSELRLKVYNQLFKFDKPVELGKNDHYGSAQFLRTCKMVRDEGTAVLYGENSFHFTRDTRVRGTYYERVWKEVAYKDVRRFLEDIGRINLSHLKHLSFQLTDASDNRTRVAPGQIVERRFVDDPQVHQIFRLIGANATLTTLALQFGGRGMVHRFDRSFLRAVTEMKSYKVVTINRLNGSNHRCEVGLMERMKSVMSVRDENGDRAEFDRVKYPVKMIYNAQAANIWTASISE